MGRVLEYWTSKSGGTIRADDVKRQIAARLKNYSVEEICRAIDGLFASPWHNGQNPDGRRYLHIRQIVRQDSRVEEFIALLEKNAAPLSTREARSRAAAERALQEWESET